MTTTLESTESKRDSATETQQFLTFQIAGEEYGIDILKVQEIKGYITTTRLPNSPPEVVGVLNLRGTIVPILDLRRQFGLEPAEYDSFAAIVVVVVEGRVTGMIVDRVSEVMSIPVVDIQSLSGRPNEKMLQGIGKVADKLVILLNVEAIVSGSQEVVAA